MSQNISHTASNDVRSWGTHPIKSILMQKVEQLAGASYQQEQNFNRLPNNNYSYKKLTKQLTNLFPYFIYGLCTARLLFYAYYIDHQIPLLLKYDFFISAVNRANIKLDRILTLSLIGVPLFASIINYLIEKRIGGGSRFAVCLFDVINRNSEQVEEAIGFENGNGCGFFVFTHRQLIFFHFTNFTYFKTYPSNVFPAFQRNCPS